MKWRKSTITLLLAAVGAAATACSTTPPPAPAAPAPAAKPAPAPVAAPPAAAKVEEPAKPISAAAAANMANNCFACHGPRGVSPGSIPSLHNLTAGNIAALLKAFKNGERPSTVMGRHAKGYTDAEIEALANHIASVSKK